MTQLDDLDQLAAEVFDGYLVKKDLAQQFRGQYPVPTYVGEFLLGRYCATTDPDEIAAGLEMVQRSMQERTVRAGEEELFKHRAREKGRVKIIDLLRARLDSKSDAYKAELPSLQLNDIHISSELVDEHQRMLTGGFYAEVTLEYIAALAQQQGGQPFRVEAIRPIQMSTHDALGEFVSGRKHFTLGAVARAAAAQRRLRPRAIHLPGARHPAAADGPVRGQQLQRRRARTSRYRQVAPLPAGLALRPPRLGRQGDDRQHVRQHEHRPARPGCPVRRDLLRRGLGRLLRPEGRRQHPQGLHGVRRVQPGQGVDPRRRRDRHGRQLRRRRLAPAPHRPLLGPLPKEMRDDTAFMDRIHAYIPGWDVPKLDPRYFTEHFGFVSDFLAEVWSRLRRASRLDVLQGRLEWGSQLSGRDRKAANNTVDGLLRLLYPDPEMEVPDEFLAWAATIALECVGA